MMSLSYLKPSVMIFHRRLLIRASLFLNFCVLTYIAVQAVQSGGSGSVNYSSNNQQMMAFNGETDSLAPPSMTNQGMLSSMPSSKVYTEMETEASSASADQNLQNNVETLLIESTTDPYNSNRQQQQQTTTTEAPALRIDCEERERRFSYSQRGSYWILNHYIPSERKFKCNESITYTTHGDVTFLDNIIPLARRWDGPLSVTVYTPGTDYDLAVRSIAYLRQCTEEDVKQKVTFHFVLDERHFPPSLRKLHPQQGLDSPSFRTVPAVSNGGSTESPSDPQGSKRIVMVRASNGRAVVAGMERSASSDQSSNSANTSKQTSNKNNELLNNNQQRGGGLLQNPFNQEIDAVGLPLADCEKPAPWSTPPQKTYKQIKNLTYPVNVLRNVARLNAPTHYVLASDAELYPSPDMVRLFLEMLRRNESVLHLGRPKVFVLPIFEVYGNQTVPTSKQELVEKLKVGLAVPFHQKVCSYCHSVPKSKEWLLANITEGLHVFHIAKRHKPYQRWEPIYIGTQDDPLYDERLTWEGKSDKMTQGYALCMLDYDFMILDNAFLVHRPGVKIPRREPLRDAMAKKQSAVIRSAIYRELKVLYGQNSNCVL